MEGIYDSHKADLVNTALREIPKFFGRIGLQVEQLSWAGNIAVPQQVFDQINAKIANEQAALAAQANVANANANANADARIAKAKGDAESIHDPRRSRGDPHQPRDRQDARRRKVGRPPADLHQWETDAVRRRQVKTFPSRRSGRSRGRYPIGNMICS